ncbi:Clp protease N-terminal domain-containing protein [Pseudorhodoplanes sp.]|uniref:Clp protease N-terminal domain-containing protein n=1 Tax=Pseudorhodoplanes sp. TaxID=1934341 RepID=UPI002B692495|nr:Clp protease N-terminal domain-containing protein [Pseudorhodoplanes sp.]HWV55624.1 Clp protease N-terminal domain-containing protein [Pseudorhodoplanes sp.]
MNTYQSPYIDGQVVEPESVGNRGSDALPVPHADAKISGCTKSASDCLHKTTKLAREFNHGTVSAAHLILAMTLIPNASRQFELRKMDIDRAFRAAMLALMDVERGSSGGALPSLSEEFNAIVTLAQDLARNRDNQEVSVDDLLTALDRLPADSSAAQLIRGERRHGASTLDIERALDQVSLSVNQQSQDLRRSIDMLRLELPGEDFVRLKSYLEQRDGTLEQMIRAGFTDLVNRLATPAPQSPEPALSPPATRPSEEDSLWGKIFGKKSFETAPPAAEQVSAQNRWGL